MNSDLTLTISVWNYLTNQFKDGILTSEKNSCLLKFSKGIVNTFYRALVGIAMLVIAVATPTFVFIDLCYKNIKASRERSVNTYTVLDFYQGAKNDKGVSLEDIWKWDYVTLEEKHDYIQWLFPLLEKGMNPTAPVTNNATMTAFRNDPNLQKKMLKSFEVMLDFYGFSLKPDGSIVKSLQFQQRSENWLTKGNHNFLRITRILTSLKLHGLEKYSTAFFLVLQDVNRRNSNIISNSTFEFWQTAVKPKEKIDEDWIAI